MASVVLEREVPFIGLLMMAASTIPAYLYVLAILLLFFVAFIYDFLEFHFVGDVLCGIRGDRVKLMFYPNSNICENVVSKCRVLQGRSLVILF